MAPMPVLDLTPSLAILCVAGPKRVLHIITCVVLWVSCLNLCMRNLNLQKSTRLGVHRGRRGGEPGPDPPTPEKLFPAPCPWHQAVFMKAGRQAVTRPLCR